MRPDTRKAVTSEFKRLLAEHSLEFRRVKAGMPWRATFERFVTDALTLYLFLHWHSYEEWFAVEVGWTFNATLDDAGSLFDAERAVQADAALIELGQIEGRLLEQWWAVGPDVSVPVREAFGELLRLGMPYHDRVAQVKLGRVI